MLVGSSITYGPFGQIHNAPNVEMSVNITSCQIKIHAF